MRDTQSVPTTRISLGAIAGMLALPHSARRSVLDPAYPFNRVLTRAQRPPNQPST
jgi:hypothetical protein